MDNRRLMPYLTNDTVMAIHQKNRNIKLRLLKNLDKFGFGEYLIADICS
jgi:hypothetical protein